MEFKDKVVIVTGGGRGIGEAIATGFAKKGAQVVVADILEDVARKVVKEIKSQGGKGLFIKTDVTKTQEVESAAKECADRFGKIDILVNNVGWYEPFYFMDTDEGFWNKIIDINLIGTLRFCKAVLGYMVEKRYGRIINIGSDAGRVGDVGDAAYVAAKGGVIAFTKGLAREVARYGINVNCVCPGPTETPLFEEQKKSELGAKLMVGIERAVPLRRAGKPEEVAAGVLFLASDEASFVTGQTLSISGGLTMV